MVVEPNKPEDMESAQDAQALDPPIANDAGVSESARDTQPSPAAANDLEAPGMADVGVSESREASGQVPEDTEDTPSKSRRRLNPVVCEQDTKPIPTRHRTAASPSAPDHNSHAATAAVHETVATTTPVPSDSAVPSSPVNDPTDEPDEMEPVAEKLAALASEEEEQIRAPIRPEPVDLPPEDVDLDAALEAEIEAALAADDASAIDESSATGVSDVMAGVSATSDEVPEEGTRLTGTVQSIHGDNVFLDLGIRAPGVTSLRQFATGKRPSLGDPIEVVVGRADPQDGLVLVYLPSAPQRLAGDWDSVEPGQTVDCMVSKTNKGGLEVQIGSIRAFMPAGQVDLSYVEDLKPYVGQKLRAKITDVNREKRNIIVSCRAHLEEQRALAEASFWESVEVGQVLTGQVKKLMDYGAFVDLGGTDGFLHIGQISWTRLNHPSEVLHEGQQVQVKVVSLEPEKKRVGLSLKQLSDNPWTTAADIYTVGKTVGGVVTRTAEFGAFIELEPGVEGLIHISELDYRRVKKVTDVLNVGQEIDVQVLSVDLERRRISLSLKALLEKPIEQTDAADQSQEDETPSPLPKHTQPLRGGLGGSDGLLFGDPNSFRK